MIKAGNTVALLSRKPLNGNGHPTTSNLTDPIYSGIMVIEKLPAFRSVWIRELVNLFYSWRIITKTLEEIKPDIVHVHNPPETIPFVVSLICSFKKIPVIYDVHDGVYELISSLEVHPVLKALYLAVGMFFEKSTLRRCSGIITVCEALRSAMMNRAGKDIGEKPFRVMKNINPELMSLSGKTAGKEKGNFILHSGTLYTATIGIDDLIEVIPRLHEKTGVKLVIAGEGPYRSKLEEHARRLGLADAVQFLGHIDRERLYRLTAEAKLCVMPFRKTRQLCVAVPNKLFEYMALGKASVYPDLPGFQEVLGENNEGKYRPDDLADMTRVIEKLLADDGLRMSVGSRNRDLLNRFSFQEELSSLLGLYETVLHKDPAITA